ncbi:MAG: ABC transporter substrate-binding protein [Candidatus Fimenecus sp.]
MKKTVSLLLVFAIMLAFAACGAKNEPETTTEPTTTYQPVTMKVAGLAGPTGVGMVKLMSDKDAGTAKNDYQFSVVSDPKEIVAGMLNSSYDIAACPVNLAATLYNKLEGNLQVLAVNTKGVLYVLENGNTINSFADLAGKKLYATGQGSTPEYILNYLLEKNGIADKVTVEYVESHDELASLAAAGKATISMLPEPKVTAAMTKNADLRIALNLTEEFEKASGKTLIQGVIVAKKDFVTNNPEAVKMFLSEYKASIGYTASNLEETATLCETYGIIPKAAMAKKAIPNCNIAYIDGADMKASVAANLQLFYDANPQSIGGKMPADDFYYGA